MEGVQGLSGRKQIVPSLFELPSLKCANQTTQTQQERVLTEEQTPPPHTRETPPAHLFTARLHDGTQGQDQVVSDPDLTDVAVTPEVFDLFSPAKYEAILPSDSNLSCEVLDRANVKRVHSIRAQLDYEQRLNQDIELELGSASQELDRLVQCKEGQYSEDRNVFKHKRHTTLVPNTDPHLQTFDVPRPAAKKTVQFQQYSLIAPALAKDKTPRIAKKQLHQ